MVITVKASAEDGAVILAAVEQVRADLDRQRQKAAPADDSAESSEPDPSTMTEAFVEMSRMVLEQLAKAHPDATRRNRSSLTASVDPLSGWGRLRDGELLPPSSLKDVMRSLPGKGVPSLALRELLGTVDGERCRFPSCTRHRKLHGHHVIYGSDGGTTDVSKLVHQQPTRL